MSPTSPDALAATAPAEPNERGPSFFYEVPVRLGGFVIPPEEALVIDAGELIAPQRLVPVTFVAILTLMVPLSSAEAWLAFCR